MQWPAPYFFKTYLFKAFEELSLDKFSLINIHNFAEKHEIKSI